MVDAYIAVTAHFFSFTRQKYLHICLGVRKIYGSHDHSTIKTYVYEIMKQYGIIDDDVSRYCTDNASNMLKAFRDSMIELHG